MDNKNLLEILNAQVGKLSDYKEIALKKQEVLTQNNIQELNKLTMLEQTLVLEIKGIEQKWINLLTQRKNSKQRFSLNEDILEKQDEIKALVNEITDINNINKMLIANARAFIKEVMSSIFNNKSRSLIDKKC